jgi:hypothetical protein
VIPEPRRSVSQSFDQNQAQAPTGGTALGDHRGPLPVHPQPALLKPSPGPLGHGACAIVRADLGFQPRPVADGGAFGWPRSCGLGSLIGLGWKGTRNPQDEKPLAMKKAAIKVAIFSDPASKIYRRYPSELHLANALKSVTVVAIWLPKIIRGPVSSS